MEAATTPAARPPKLLIGLPLAALAILIGTLLGFAVILGGTPGCGGGEQVVALGPKVPRRLAPIYMDAAERYGLGARGPSILAAINWVETGFGTDLGNSSAGAEGWMQFEAESWAEFGVDADGDGVKDPDDPWDAIFAAARLLHSDGAPGEWRLAIWDYNHADWYVEKVLRYARRFSGGGQAQSGSSCAAAAVAANEAVARMVAEAARLSALRPHTEYVWGGSHGETPTPADGPFDCSSAVSHLLQVGGFGNPTMATPELARWGEPGPGRWVTIFVKPYGGEAHTFIRFSADVTPASERYWGTSGFVEPGHGPGWIPESTFSAGYLSGFLQRHPPGL
ncbi:MAG TPA: lytic transglycosylase domain-containing protein [Solirubrobacterales bacterium]|nr:lytic transglycosylase domain-containing protein [Solirubrobacterales bacterium]